MATVTRTFSFSTDPTLDTPAWSATAGAQSSLTWDSTIGNPAGALKARITGRSKSNANYWQWQGTWEQLGVPAGSTVTAVRVNAGYTRCTEYTTGASSSIGPYELRDGTGTLQATLWAGRTVSGVDGSWVAVAAQADQSVPSALQASSSTVQLRLADTLATGSSNSAAVSTYDDEISLVVTYTAAAQTISPAGIGTAEAVGAATVTPGPVTVAPTGLVTGEAFGSATVSNAAPSQSITATGVGTAEAFGSATVTPGAVMLTPTGVTSAETFGTPTIGAGAVAVSPAGISTTETFGAATVTAGPVTVAPGGVGSGETVGTPAVTPGPVTISPTGIGSVEAFGAPAVTVGVVTLTPAGVTSGETFGLATITPGAVTLLVAGIPTGEGVGLATVTAAAAGTQTVAPPGITAAGAVGSPTVQPGAVTVSPAGIASAETTGAVIVIALDLPVADVIGAVEAWVHPAARTDGTVHHSGTRTEATVTASTRTDGRTTPA